jgi:hypothetical protein
MQVTRKWKVYGQSGHRNRMSFQPSFRFDFSKQNDFRIIDVDCFDKTGTNDFVIVSITRNSPEECEREFFGQLSDGLFENSRFGKTEEI